MKSTDKQRKASMRSCFRYFPGSRDEGQRYAVTYHDGVGTKREYGFTDDQDQAMGWLSILRADTRWSRAAIKDRKA